VQGRKQNTNAGLSPARNNKEEINRFLRLVEQGKSAAKEVVSLIQLKAAEVTFCLCEYPTNLQIRTQRRIPTKEVKRNHEKQNTEVASAYCWAGWQVWIMQHDIVKAQRFCTYI
jgi:hypothetical protein